VEVITAAPHYPSGKVPPRYRSFRFRREKNQGVNVIRVPLPSLDRSNLALRLLQYIIYQIGMTIAGLRASYDVVITSNPALQVGLPFTILAVLRRKPAIYSVHDVYPDAGVKLGIFRNGFVIRTVAVLERFCLYRAKRVRILSKSFMPGMKSLGVDERKVALIYDWVETDFIKPLPHETRFAKEHGIVGKFIVLYAGNLGLSQGLEVVLAAAERLALESDVHFVFVGSGAGKKQLIAEASRRKLHNVSFIPFQPRERLPEILATADISLVVLKRGVIFSLPSKIFSIFASGRPLLASVDEASDSWQMIIRSQAGLCVPPENPARLSQLIMKLKQAPELRRQMGARGRSFALEYHSPEAAAEEFEHLLEAISKN